MGDERDEPSDEIQSELGTLLDPSYAAKEQAQHIELLERVLAGLEAIDVAETAAEREAALDALPESTGEDDELDLLLGQLKSSSIYVSDFGMTLKVAIGRASYVRQLVAPTRLNTKLPRLDGSDAPRGSDGRAGPDGVDPSPDEAPPTRVRKVKKVRKRRRRPPEG